MAEADGAAEALAAGVLAGERRALGRAITLVESEREEDAAVAEAVLARVLPHTGRALRVGITGPPGAGKSTLIDALGRLLVRRGERVAVLAIDPSSPVGGGSILGDKTRMGRLAAADASFIRPSPSRGEPGGVGRYTLEAIALCEAAGYGVVLVETVGTGQGEHQIAELVDCVVLVLIPGAGDELSGMKRGAVELADVVVVNKADGPALAASERARGDLESALGLFARATGAAPRAVLGVSAAEERGLDALWAAVTAAADAARSSGAFERRRAAGARRAFRQAVERALLARLARSTPAERRVRLEEEVVAGRLPARTAARQLLADATSEV